MFIVNRFNANKLIEGGYSILLKIIEHHKGLNPDQKFLIVAGSYDMLHIGHARYIKKCRETGAIVIVLVDTNEAIQIAKGSKGGTRPVIPYIERAEMLAHLQYTDYILPLEDFDPVTGLWKVELGFTPDIIVVSKREPADDEVFLEKLRLNCGELIILESQATTSTSAKIRLVMTDGAREAVRKIKDLIAQLEIDIGGDA